MRFPISRFISSMPTARTCCHCLSGKEVERLDAEAEVSSTTCLGGAMVVLPGLRSLYAVIV